MYYNKLTSNILSNTAIENKSMIKIFKNRTGFIYYKQKHVINKKIFIV